MNECRNWETKYNELYLKYMNQGQDTALIEENNALRRRVRQLEEQAQGREQANVRLRGLV